MEDRRTQALYLEMTDLAPEAYGNERMPAVLKAPGAERATLWTNCRPHRDEFPRTIPEFETLVVFEVTRDFRPPPAPAGEGVRGHLYHRTARPGQGTLSGRPTLGLELVLVSTRTPEGGAPFRAWADFLHIREIAAANVPGFTRITPYENAGGDGPRFLHFYEMDTPDAEEAFQQMAPLTLKRMKAQGNPRADEWLGHPELVIDYVNTFTRVGEALP
jgi:hypothetical protein